MNIKYRQLRAFVWVAELKSFRSAAERLAISQPSLSVLIRALENDLNLTLFERTTRQSRLTDAGTAFLQRLAPILDDLEDVYRYAQAIGAGNAGRLKLAALPSLSAGIVAKTLAEFQKRSPNVKVQLREMRNAAVFDAVRQGEVEIGLASLVQHEPDITFQKLFKDKLQAIVPPKHALSEGRVTWKAVGQFPLILMKTGTVELALRRSGVDANSAFDVENMATALSMVRNGLGVTIAASSALVGLNCNRVIVLPIHGKYTLRTLGVAYRKGRPLTAAANAFIELMKGKIISP
jgi:LysR family transcriptional regulator, carnitine catabolism transcriptional activator